MFPAALKNLTVIISRRGIPAAAALIFAAGLAGTGCAGNRHSRITILHTNDLHGHVLPRSLAGEGENTGGYAVFVSWVESVRRENRRREIPTLLLDAGDIFMGTPEGNLTRGAAVIELMNAAGYDALAVGNHEFDFGYENLERLAGIADFPFLSANIRLGPAGPPPDFITPLAKIEYPGLTVFLIGLTTEETGRISLPGHVSELEFGDPAEALRDLLSLPEFEADNLLVAVTHLGRDRDRELAGAVPEIDVIIGGHSHDLIRRPELAETGALICQAGAYGLHAGRLDLTVDKKTGRVVSHRYRLFENREGVYPPDPEIAGLLGEITENIGLELDREVGKAEGDLFPPDRGESGLGNLLSDAIRETAGTDIAFHNAYGIRSPIPAGRITLRDLYLVMPFDNTIVTMELTGGQIGELLEQSLTLRKGMLQVSGLRAEYRLQPPEGERLVALEIGGAPVRDQAVYTAAVNSFLAAGGDYFDTFTAGSNARDTGVAVRDALAETVQRRSPLPPEGAPERLIEIP